MNKSIEKMSEQMFPAEGSAVVNVKFFPGNARAVSANQLANQLERADAQIKTGAVQRSRKLDGGLTVTAL